MLNDTYLSSKSAQHLYSISFSVCKEFSKDLFFGALRFVTLISCECCIDRCPQYNNLLSAMIWATCLKNKFRKENEFGRRQAHGN